jgi:hypothetical protein
MKSILAAKRIFAPLSRIRVKIGKQIWSGRNTDVHEAQVYFNRNEIIKKRSFSTKVLKTNNPSQYQVNNFAKQVDICDKLKHNLRKLSPKKRTKLWIVPTLRIGLGQTNEQLLIRTKLDALSISQLQKKHPNQVRNYFIELKEASNILSELNFSADSGAFSAVKGKDGNYHPMLIDFDMVRKN